jgi:hypothetical protein
MNKKKDLLVLYFKIKLKSKINVKTSTLQTMGSKRDKSSRILWLTLIILAIQEAEIKRIAVQSQLKEIVRKTLS